MSSGAPEDLRRTDLQTVYTDDAAFLSEEIEAMGGDEAFEDRADELIVRALVAQDAELVMVDQPHADLKDGIGALLRFDSRPERPGAG